MGILKEETDAGRFCLEQARAVNSVICSIALRKGTDSDVSLQEELDAR
jgi:hypothetical protein